MYGWSVCTYLGLSTDRYRRENLLTRRLLALLCLAVVGLAVHAGVATAANPPCPGAPECPWTGTPAVFGEVAPGSIRGASDIAYDAPRGVVWVMDRNRSQLKKYSTTDGALVAAYGSEGRGNTQFNVPGGVAVDASGNVYVADGNNNVVKKFDTNGAFQLSFGTGTQGSGDGQLVLPADVAVDSLGYVYVADIGNSRIQKFAPNGSFDMKWGSGGTGDGQFGQINFGSFTAGTGPTGLAIDTADNSVYAVDGGNNRVQKFSSTGAFQAKTGVSGSDPGQFQSPGRIAVHGGSMYVTEEWRLQKLDASTASSAARRPSSRRPAVPTGRSRGSLASRPAAVASSPSRATATAAATTGCSTSTLPPMLSSGSSRWTPRASCCDPRVSPAIPPATSTWRTRRRIAS